MGGGADGARPTVVMHAGISGQCRNSSAYNYGDKHYVDRVGGVDLGQGHVNRDRGCERGPGHMHGASVDCASCYSTGRIASTARAVG